MIGLLNLGSLCLGLIAWILPIISLLRYKKSGHRNWSTLSLLSVSACALALCFQILYNLHLVNIKDWTALMDTMGAVVFATAVLMTVTILLNGINLLVYRKKTA